MGFNDYKWILGVGLAAIASIISNLGINLQKLSHQNSEKERSDASESLNGGGGGGGSATERNYLFDKTWALGLGLIILGSVGDFLALGFAAQSIVAPLGSLTLVSNVFFAPIVLGEKLDSKDWIGTGAIVVGSALAVAFASHESATYTFEQLFDFYMTIRFAVYAGAVLLSCFLMYTAIQRLERMQGDGTRTVEYENLRMYHRFLYGALSGIAGAQSVLFGKCTAEMFVATFAGRGLFFVYWQSYFIITGMVASILLQIKWLNDGLMRFDSVSLIPIFQSFWILVSVMGGIVFFGEAIQFTVLQAIMFPLGVMITIGGVYMLSRRALVPRTDSVTEHVTMDEMNDGADLEYAIQVQRSDVLSDTKPIMGLQTPSTFRKTNTYNLDNFNEVDAALLINNADDSQMVLDERSSPSHPPQWWPKEKPKEHRPLTPKSLTKAVEAAATQSAQPLGHDNSDEIMNFVNQARKADSDFEV